MIHVSDIGIPESEAFELIESLFNDDNNNKILINKLIWSQIVLLLKPFLAYQQLDYVQLIKLEHNILHKVLTFI